MAAEIDVGVDQVCTEVRKAPGVDGISDSVWTIIDGPNPGILDMVLNSPLKSGVLLNRLKVSWLVYCKNLAGQSETQPRFGGFAC